jgi:hypothetical protein
MKAAPLRKLNTSLAVESEAGTVVVNNVRQNVAMSASRSPRVLNRDMSRSYTCTCRERTRQLQVSGS